MSDNAIHVAVGVIINAHNEVLLARRPDHLHQGGLWEFPGGKLDAGESVQQALIRELHEEVGLQVTHSEPLITIPHDYGDRHVYLDVHWVREFEGEAKGEEGQAVRWVALEALSDYAFPAANRPILNAIQLPTQYVITGRFNDLADCEYKVRRAIERGIRLIQLRAKDLADDAYLQLARAIQSITAEHDARLILNTTQALFAQTQADGLHYTGQRLAECRQRPVADDTLFSVSCHSEAELQRGVELGADFAMLSPVLPTASHPGEPALGWPAFADIVSRVAIPVYALGGMQPDLIQTAQQHGAQGIAAISALWE